MFCPAESALIEFRIGIGLEISSDFVQEGQQCSEAVITTGRRGFSRGKMRSGPGRLLYFKE